MTFRRLFSSILVILSFSFLCGQPLQVSPGSIRVNISKSELLSSEIKITNTLSVPLNIRSNFDIRWIKLQPADFLLLPGNSRKVKVIFFKPEDTTTGEKSVIWFHSNVENFSASVQVLHSDITEKADRDLGEKLELKTYKKIYSELVLAFRPEIQKRFMLLELHENNIYISLLNAIYFKDNTTELTEIGKKVFTQISNFLSKKAEDVNSFNIMDFSEDEGDLIRLNRKNKLMYFFKEQNLNFGFKKITQEEYISRNNNFKIKENIIRYLHFMVSIKWS